MFDRILNSPLNEIWDRKKGVKNYFPGWNVCLAYAYFFTHSRLDMLINIMLIKKHVMMLFVWKSFTKSLNKVKYRTNIFWKIFYSAIHLTWLTWLTLVNLRTVKVHKSSKAFNNSTVVLFKRILWRRASLL